MKLDLGAGKVREKGWIPIDIVDFGDNVVLDIVKDGLKPYKDSSIDAIRAYAFMEHVSQCRVIFVMNECWRVLKKGGLFDILVPDAQYAMSAFSDPTHLSTWTSETFDKYFTGIEPQDADYGIKKWKVEAKECYIKTLRYKLKK